MVSQSYERKRTTVPFKWELVSYEKCHDTVYKIMRSNVIGGWVFNTVIEHVKDFNTIASSQSLVFVPDENHEWEL